MVAIESQSIFTQNFRKKYRLRDLKKKIKSLIKTVPTVTVTVVTEKQLQLGTVSEKQLQNRYGRYNIYSRNDPPWIESEIYLQF